jgi:enoyl-CoA hydratase/carnithine racemase
MSSSAPPRELADGKLLIDEPLEAVVRLTISNPAKRNALDHPILDAISATLGELSSRSSGARCVIVTGAHGMFSAGYDIGEIPDEEFEERAERLVAHPFTQAIDALEAFPYPTLAALPGHTIGGGLELALACDLRVAQAGIKLGMPPAKLGLVYSHTGLRRFIDAIGAARRASCSCWAATSTRRRRSRGGWSTAWLQRRSWRRRRSRWRASWRATRRCRRRATSA